MIKNKDTAFRIAEELLKIKAVKLRPQNPFTWASGWKSPIYCDNRITLSYPAVRTYIRQEFCSAILANFGKPDVIAGVATGGVPQGVLVAQELGIPFIYIRSASKEHGMGNLIEGLYEEGQKVVVLEDLISTGGSSLKAVESLREAGLIVKGLACIFTYGFSLAERNFEKAECPYITLTDYSVLIEQALSANYINEEDLVELRKWKENPAKWNSPVK
jgi:orotate phosphoribosyltransferase